jgi:phosphatidylethanolamine-binding protein (PEBP) family uncharacterized protein
MQRHMKAIPAVALLSALALAGCGSSGSAGTTSAASGFGTITFQSPVLSISKVPAPIAARYTCDGKNIAPPMEWGPVPTGTKELAIFLVELTTTTASPFVPVWAIAGVNPSLRKLAAGELPPGAHVGADPKGTKRYSLCPKKGETKAYQFLVYSLRPGGQVAPSFSDNTLLSEIASGPSPTSATAGGGIRVVYTRKA